MTTEKRLEMTNVQQEKLRAGIRFARVVDMCQGEDEHGWPVRGYVTQITCSCGHARWNDGTPCPLCHRYPNSRFVKEEESLG